MGQFTLGLRSLLIKSAIFVVMAALLAWALGGTLWPRPVHVMFSAGQFGEYQMRWRMTVHRDNASDPGHPVTWELLFGKDRKSIGIDGRDPESWAQVAGPVSQTDRLFIGRMTIDPLQSKPDAWGILEIDGNLRKVASHFMPDRLAVEQQLERAKAGLPVQDAETIQRQRQSVLDPQ